MELLQKQFSRKMQHLIYSIGMILALTSCTPKTDKTISPLGMVNEMRDTIYTENSEFLSPLSPAEPKEECMQLLRLEEFDSNRAIVEEIIGKNILPTATEMNRNLKKKQAKTTTGEIVDNDKLYEMRINGDILEYRGDTKDCNLTTRPQNLVSAE